MLTKEQKEKLHKAIDLAKGLGKCEYTDINDVPVCVIGQLAFLENCTANSFKECQNDKIKTILNRGGLTELKDYPESLLTQLQNWWDGSDVDETDKVKEQMHNYVNSL